MTRTRILTNLNDPDCNPRFVHRPQASEQAISKQWEATVLHGEESTHMYTGMCPGSQQWYTEKAC